MTTVEDAPRRLLRPIEWCVWLLWVLLWLAVVGIVLLREIFIPGKTGGE